jgi:hypothetical protein
MYLNSFFIMLFSAIIIIIFDINKTTSPTYKTCMALAPHLQKQILLLYLEEKSAYAISQEVGINYRTAQKYVEKIEQMIDAIKGTLVCCIFDEIRKSPDVFVENYMQMQEMQYNEEGNNEESN